MRDLEWMGRAACKGLPYDVFFPPGFRYARARAVCAACPVKLDCLAFALDLGADKGMFGGLTPSQRADLRARLRVA